MRKGLESAREGAGVMYPYPEARKIAKAREEKGGLELDFRCGVVFLLPNPYILLEQGKRIMLSFCLAYRAKVVDHGRSSFR